MRSRYLLFSFLVLPILPSASPADVTTGLMARYTFDGNANDLSGNGNHGSSVGGLALTTDRFGVPNAAYLFNGLNSYVSIPNSASLSSPTTAVTQSAWISIAGRSQVGAGFGPIIMKSTESTNAFMYRMNAETTYFGSAYNNWTTHLSATANIPLNEWHHVATVFNGSSIRFYFDGTFVGTQPLSLTIIQDTRLLTIGADFPGVPEYFNGKIDDVSLFSRALSDADILELYGQTTDVGAPETVSAVVLERPFPNPTNAPVSIHFSVGARALVQMAIYDVAGRQVRRLRSGTVEKGRYPEVWDGRDDSGNLTPAGLYLVRLRAGNRQRSTRILRLQ